MLAEAEQNFAHQQTGSIAQLDLLSDRYSFSMIFRGTRYKDEKENDGQSLNTL